MEPVRIQHLPLGLSMLRFRFEFPAEASLLFGGRFLMQLAENTLPPLSKRHRAACGLA